MNCQPSFKTGSILAPGPVMDDLLGLALGAHGRGEEAAVTREPPRRRVPDCDIIDVGAYFPPVRPGDPVDVSELALTGGAAVRAPAPAGPNRRNYTKPVLALLILQVAVVGGFHIRKRIAEAQVIVVPTTADERTVIT